MTENAKSSNNTVMESMTHAWQPVLEGELRVRAQRVLDDIVTALHVDAVELQHGALTFGGAAGRALFFSYVAKVRNDRQLMQSAEDYLSRSAEHVAAQVLHCGLFGGFTALAFVNQHIAALANTGDGDRNAQIDEALLDYVSQSPWPGDYDLITGLAGLGVYALERLPQPTARKILEQIVLRLDETAERGEVGIMWRRHPGLLTSRMRAVHPRGFYDMGVAHGIPGVILVLAASVAANVAPTRAAMLLGGAWDWMMAHRLPPDEETAFPHIVDENVTATPSRSAWCYGDPGATCAMHASALLVANALWRDESLALAKLAARRPISRAGCVDGGLCHGAAGVALIFSRMWQRSGDELFAQAARMWYAALLEMRRPGCGIAGFQTFSVALHGETDRWIDDPSFLTGVEGIGLSLLAGVSDVEPAWDRLLAMSSAVGMRYPSAIA